TGELAWIPDVLHDNNFPRASYAARAGLHAAVGFPVRVGNDILGVIEFLSREIRQPDADLLALLAGVGGQIGQFMERMWAEQHRTALLESEQAARVAAEQERERMAGLAQALAVERERLALAQEAAHI